MHNNKPIKDHDQGFIYVRKKDLDNAITYGLFNNTNEKEEYTIDNPRPNPNDFYIIEIKGTEKIKSGEYKLTDLNSKPVYEDTVETIKINNKWMDQ